MHRSKTDASEVIPFPSTAVTSTDTLPTAGYDNVRFNALKHGVLSRHTVLAHEDSAEFAELLAALAAEHQPVGPTELHLVEELAGAIWRKRRVLQAEGAVINRGLLAVSKARHDRAIDPDGPARAAVPFEHCMEGTRLNTPAELAEAMQESPMETNQRVTAAEMDLAATHRAVDLLRQGGRRAYQRALRALTSGSADLFADGVEDGSEIATPEGLSRFLREFLLPFCRQAAAEARHHEAIKAQTVGEGLPVNRLESLSRYETHLDRKFERTLAMLLKLKELRRTS